MFQKVSNGNGEWDEKPYARNFPDMANFRKFSGALLPSQNVE